MVLMNLDTVCIHAEYYTSVWLWLYLVELSMKGTAELHVLHQVGALTLVWRDYADLVRFGSGLQQASGDLFHVSGLGPAHTFPSHLQLLGKA